MFIIRYTKKPKTSSLNAVRLIIGFMDECRSIHYGFNLLTVERDADDDFRGWKFNLSEALVSEIECRCSSATATKVSKKGSKPKRSRKV